MENGSDSMAREGAEYNHGLSAEAIEATFFSESQQSLPNKDNTVVLAESSPKSKEVLNLLGDFSIEGMAA